MPNKRQRKQKKQGVGSTGANQLATRGPSRKSLLVDIAATTLQKIAEGAYTVDGVPYPLGTTLNAVNNGTVFYPADCDLMNWFGVGRTLSDDLPPSVQTSVLEISTLEGCRSLHETLQSTSTENKRIGVLNFASAKNPGGGFINGAQAQEESIARSSTIYQSLMTPTAQTFYASHRKNPHEGYYSHAMIYSPHVLLLRKDDGEWHAPIEVEMVTSCAVNAGVARRKIYNDDETEIETTMRERMGRILYLFEQKGAKNLVLGSFGTGVFRNKVDVVSRIWFELLIAEDARYRYSFDRAVFAILGHDTFLTFQRTFTEQESDVSQT